MDDQKHTPGPKRKPVHLLKKYDADRRPDGVPQADGAPVRPQYMRREANDLWDAVVPLLVEMNTVGLVDTTQLQAMCEWWAEYRFWEKQVPDPQTVSAKAKAYAQFLSVSSKFGLTPADRKKIKPRAPKETVSAFTELLLRKQTLGASAG